MPGKPHIAVFSFSDREGKLGSGRLAADWIAAGLKASKCYAEVKRLDWNESCGSVANEPHPSYPWFANAGAAVGVDAILTGSLTSRRKIAVQLISSSDAKIITRLARSTQNAIVGSLTCHGVLNRIPLSDRPLQANIVGIAGNLIAARIEEALCLAPGRRMRCSLILDTSNDPPELALSLRLLSTDIGELVVVNGKSNLLLSRYIGLTRLKIGDSLLLTSV